ncbi:MAG: IcmN protein, OmpA family [uncultured bacterium]|nr:MAG: IcmN protein, OmpA family [uncultured bacterium]OGT26883.1 MAG: hypothetical protein A3B71_02135 [Gammaproteobacteria bacterium RIFCSPHIGHO2_02_FULL_42_43]OGT27642.1 MAG: hypothetical protein A2624_00280 [Gammaproteobacteria bacterium RIFCSPHIGHO2_01_FULL_42_8]OGT53380.1 MAG: hypothetical protein A3E54_06640 [Gammaproteobacteria bacterium RIFCSPHIGHO2_12_FULL_41_25]OGT63424.1 MAG: hypothetical protein A3I77_05865 [Gammaproteobacteria bacterium RIFCSPLOWO2_02_FULL_42_14]OGT87350.1 MAG: 
MEVTKILKIIILSAVIAAGISACASTCEDLLKKPVVLIQEPLVHPSKPIPIIQRRRYDLCVLHHEGIEIVQLGQTWKLVLPSDDVFVNETAELQDAAKPVLDVVADFLQTYSKISIQVAAFSNKSVVEEKTKFGSVIDQLTEEQAAEVTKYLTSRNTNARLIYAVGRGNREEIAWPGSEIGRKLNRRVEIYFRYYHENKAWY